MALSSWNSNKKILGSLTTSYYDDFEQAITKSILASNNPDLIEDFLRIQKAQTGPQKGTQAHAKWLYNYYKTMQEKHPGWKPKQAIPAPPTESVAAPAQPGMGSAFDKFKRLSTKPSEPLKLLPESGSQYKPKPYEIPKEVPEQKTPEEVEPPEQSEMEQKKSEVLSRIREEEKKAKEEKQQGRAKRKGERISKLLTEREGAGLKAAETDQRIVDLSRRFREGDTEAGAELFKTPFNKEGSIEKIMNRMAKNARFTNAPLDESEAFEAMNSTFVEVLNYYDPRISPFVPYTRMLLKYSLKNAAKAKISYGAGVPVKKTQAVMAALSVYRNKPATDKKIADWINRNRDNKNFRYLKMTEEEVSKTRMAMGGIRSLEEPITSEGEEEITLGDTLVSPDEYVEKNIEKNLADAEVGEALEGLDELKRTVYMARANGIEFKSIADRLNASGYRRPDGKEFTDWYLRRVTFSEAAQQVLSSTMEEKPIKRDPVSPEEANTLFTKEVGESAPVQHKALLEKINSRLSNAADKYIFAYKRGLFGKKMSSSGIGLELVKRGILNSAQMAEYQKTGTFRILSDKQVGSRYYELNRQLEEGTFRTPQEDMDLDMGIDTQEQVIRRYDRGLVRLAARWEPIFAGIGNFLADLGK